MSVRSAFKCLVVVAVAWSGLVRAAPAESVDSLSVSFASPLGSKVSSSLAKVALVEVGSETLTLVSTRQIGPITESVVALSNTASPAEKRATVDLRGARCSTQCGHAGTLMATPADCVVVYQTLYNQQGSFTIGPRTIVHWDYLNCSAYLINNSGDSITYDYLDYGGVAQWLNGHCVMGDKATIGTCLFDRYPDYGTGVYGSVNHPKYFGDKSSNSTAPGGTTPDPAAAGSDTSEASTEPEVAVPSAGPA